MDFQMRNLVLMEPETGEVVQIAYLCDADLSEQVFDKYSLRELGTANNQMFFQLGIYPVCPVSCRKSLSSREVMLTAPGVFSMPV